MRTFVPAPGKRQIDQRKPSGSQRQSGRIAVDEMREIYVTARQGDLSGFRGEDRAERAIQHMLDVDLKQQEVRRAEAIILETGQRRFAVDIRPAQRRLKI